MAVIGNRVFRVEYNHPRMGEVVRHGARLGIFLGRCGHAHYIIHWEGNERPEFCSAQGIDGTGELDEAYLGDFVDIELNVVRRRGGLRIGARRIKRNPADLARKRKSILAKKTGSAKVGGGADDPSTPAHRATSGKMPHRHKHVRRPDKSDPVTEARTGSYSCNKCGKRIVPDLDSVEPWYCPSCQKRMGLIHSPEMEETS